MSKPDVVVAAGAVVVRRGRKKEREVLLVHRPKYDDWSFPKGKAEPGEHVTATAVREVAEETGVEIRLGRPLVPQMYAVSGGRTKIVHYWVGRVLGSDDLSTYQPNDEVDQLAWVPVAKAPSRLSYLDDIATLEHFLEIPQRTSTLVIVRHGRARKRTNWKGDDRQRPLTEVGQLQAQAIVPVLHAYGVTRVVTSPSRRCADTVRPYAADSVLPVEEWPGLSEEETDGPGIDDLLDRALRAKESVAICSHRPVLPHMLEHLGLGEEPLAPSEMVVCHHRGGRIVATERHLVR